MNKFSGECLFVDPSERGETFRSGPQPQTGRTCQALQHGSHPLQPCPTRYSNY